MKKDLELEINMVVKLECTDQMASLESDSKIKSRFTLGSLFDLIVLKLDEVLTIDGTKCFFSWTIGI